MDDTNEKKRLYPVNMDYDAESNSWTMAVENGGRFNFKATPDMVRRLLRRCKAKDSMTSPNSAKKKTYNDMIAGMQDKSFSKIYMWKSKLPVNIETVRELMKD
jgi:hypothetical protein